MVMPGTEERPGRRPRSGYLPPNESTELDTRELGFEQSFLLRFPILYAAGNLALLDTPAVAIVGSRAVSDEGHKRAERMARLLVEAGLVVMSGLALGIDGAAHRSALLNGGRTIAVIGTPLDRVYPAEHAALQEEIYREHLLISPFKPGTKTQPSHFPERNRVMARLARATVIVEASDTSGALHQAVECIKAGRALFIAKSVAENPKLSWPARFLGKPGVYVLDDPQRVVELARS